jgi:type I restriction enzyme S subunit
MAVKPGFKQTEVGVIPDEWEVRTFGKNYAEPSRNGIYKSAEFQGRGTRIVNMGEMFGFDFISNQEMSRVELTLKEIATTGLSDGDLLFGRRSVVPAGAGKCSLVVDPSEPLTFESSIIRVRLNQAGASPLFHYYFFASTAGRELMSIIVAGTNVKGIRGSELRELKIPRPSLPEQSAIATALSDVDALLVALERLIAKKRDLKQAAMQQLLTGQTRLPGFYEEWVVKRLGDVARVQRGASPRPIDSPVWFDQNSSVGWVRISDVTKSGIYLRETTQRLSPLGVQHSRPVSRGSLIMSICATVGRPVVTEIDVCIHDGFVVFDDLQADKLFIYYTLKWIEPHWSKHGQTGSQMNLNTGLITCTEVSLPPLPEQNAIAAVLSDMDAELTALEQRLTKTRALKQGMMQELLTGRTRLL